MAFIHTHPQFYYNEFDPGAAAWLRELIRAGLIADGEVDERSILDVSADDLRGFTQVHFFAGIGGWSYALRLAGWPDDRPVWTGSPPCQPFSAAGKQKGRDDARHLAPPFYQPGRGCPPRSAVWRTGRQRGCFRKGYKARSRKLCRAASMGLDRRSIRSAGSRTLRRWGERFPVCGRRRPAHPPAHLLRGCQS